MAGDPFLATSLFATPNDALPLRLPFVARRSQAVARCRDAQIKQ
jgi:hypothetical protein